MLRTNNKKKDKKNNVSFISIFLVAILIYYNNETFPLINFKSTTRVTFYIISIIAVFFFFNILIKKKKINKKGTFVIMILIFLIFITIFFNHDFSGGFGVVIMGLLIGYMLTHLISLEEFAASYVRVMLILAAYSLVVMYLIRPLTFSMPTLIFPKMYNSIGYPFIDARLCVVLDNINNFRNFGIFREPGVYQVFLNFALLFELFFKKTKISIINVMVFYIAIISTFSIVGFITGGILIFSFIIFGETKLHDSYFKKNKRILVIFIVLILIMTIFLYFINDIFRYMFIDSIEKLTKKTSSFQGREVAIYANLKTWTKKPIFGNGIVKGIEGALNSMMNDYGFSTSHNTSTTGALIVIFGSIFTFIYMYYIYRLLVKSRCKIWVIILSYIAITISINTQLLIYNELLYTIVVFGIFGNNVKNDL